MAKVQPCRNGCGTSIVVQLDSESGKYKPYQFSAEYQDYSELHNCPNSPYNKGGGAAFRATTPITRAPSPQKPIIQNDTTPKDVPRHSEGGLPLDTKRILQMLKEINTTQNEQSAKIDLIYQKIEENMLIDSKVYNNHMSTIYEVMEPLLHTQIKTGKELYEETKNPTFINHAKRAEDKINFMQSKSKTKFIDESKEDKTLDEKIPDNDDEFAVSQSLKEDDEGVIDDE